MVGNLECAIVGVTVVGAAAMGCAHDGLVVGGSTDGSTVGNIVDGSSEGSLLGMALLVGSSE